MDMSEVEFRDRYMRLIVLIDAGDIDAAIEAFQQIWRLTFHGGASGAAVRQTFLLDQLAAALKQERFPFERLSSLASHLESCITKSCDPSVETCDRFVVACLRRDEEASRRLLNEYTAQTDGEHLSLGLRELIGLLVPRCAEEQG